MNRDDRRNGGKRTGPMVVAGLMAAFLCGCISVPIGDKKFAYGKPEITTKLVGMEGAPKFHPDVKRNRDVVQLRLMLTGMFVEETTTTQTYTVRKQKLAVGLFPGMADDVSDLVLIVLNSPCIPVVHGIYNAVLLGTPTLSGLLVEPFLPARDSGTFRYEFRRGALVGFSKYQEFSESVTEKSNPRQQSITKTQPVEQIALWFDAEPKFWESSAQDGDALVLRGVAAGRHAGRLYIKSVPAGHLHEKELKRMEWVPIDVEIPE